jgi:hypothetical protein
VEDIAPTPSSFNRRASLDGEQPQGQRTTEEQRGGNDDPGGGRFSWTCHQRQWLSVPPSGHHRKRQTQSCSSLVWDSRVGLACCSAYRIPSHPHDASTGPMMAPCGPVHLTNRSSVAAQEGLGSAVQVAGVPHQTGDAAGPMLTAAMPRQKLREPIFSLLRIWRRAQPLCVSAARRGVPSR